MNPSASLVPLATSALGWAMLLLATVASFGSAGAARFRAPPRWLWWLLVGGALLAFRWPLLWVPHQRNPDESQLIAGALPSGMTPFSGDPSTAARPAR